MACMVTIATMVLHLRWIGSGAKKVSCAAMTLFIHGREANLSLFTWWVGALGARAWSSTTSTHCRKRNPSIKTL